MCSSPAKPDGSMCNDGDLCTYDDTCHAGVCTGGTPITCSTPGDACHEAATCEPSTGQCVNAPKPDGTPCSDANACTQTDTCQAGACTGGDEVECDSPDPCHVGVCRPRSGTCKVRRMQPGFRACMRVLRQANKQKNNDGKGK
jgi:hypothetical protein